jgi:hypothetical protein
MTTIGRAAAAHEGEMLSPSADANEARSKVTTSIGRGAISTCERTSVRGLSENAFKSSCGTRGRLR